eukprot:403359819
MNTSDKIQPLNLLQPSPELQQDLLNNLSSSKNALQQFNFPKDTITSLSKNCIRQMVQDQKACKGQSFIVQVLQPKDIQLERMKEKSTESNMDQSSNHNQDQEAKNQEEILILTKPPKIIYKNMKTKIGIPKDYELNLAEMFHNENLKIDIDIPRSIINQNLANRDEDELIKESMEHLDVNSTAHPTEEDRTMSQSTLNVQSNSNSPQKNDAKNQSQQRSNQYTSNNNQNRNIQQDSNKCPEYTQEPNQAMKNQSSNQAGDDLVFTPIKALSTFHYDWRIKARIIKKYEKKTWKNQRNEGSLMNIDLMDSFGTQIQATFFRDALIKFGDMIKEGHIYLFSNGQVKLANQKFTSIKNDFCLVFDKQADIKEVPDDTSINQNGYNFVTVKDILTMEKSKVVDIIAVIINPGNLIELQTKAGQNKVKRLITIADDSYMSVNVCFWTESASKFDLLEGNHVVALRGVRVVDFQGKQLNFGDDAQMIKDFDHPRTYQLKKWFENLNSNDIIRSINKSDKESPKKASNKDSTQLVAELLEQLNLNEPEQNSYAKSNKFFTINCNIAYIRNDDKVLYLACPEETCNRKVIEEQPNVYKCEFCNRTYDRCVPTYMLMVKLQDQSDSIYVNFYRELGSQIMAASANEIKRLKDENQHTQISDQFFDSQFKNYQILIKAKQSAVPNQNGSNVSDDNNRTSFYASKILNHSFPSENRELLKRLQLYRSIRDNLNDKVQKLENDLDMQKRLNDTLINRIQLLEEKVIDSRTQSRGNSVVRSNFLNQTAKNKFELNNADFSKQNSVDFRAYQKQSRHQRNMSDIVSQMKKYNQNKLLNMTQYNTNTFNPVVELNSDTFDSNLDEFNCIVKSIETDEEVSDIILNSSEQITLGQNYMGIKGQISHKPKVKGQGIKVPQLNTSGMQINFSRQLNQNLNQSQVANLTEFGQDYFKKKTLYKQVISQNKNNSNSIGGKNQDTRNQKQEYKSLHQANLQKNVQSSNDLKRGILKNKQAANRKSIDAKYQKSPDQNYQRNFEQQTFTEKLIQTLNQKLATFNSQKDQSPTPQQYQSSIVYSSSLQSPLLQSTQNHTAVKQSPETIRQNYLMKRIFSVNEDDTEKQCQEQTFGGQSSLDSQNQSLESSPLTTIGKGSVIHEQKQFNISIDLRNEESKESDQSLYISQEQQTVMHSQVDNLVNAQHSLQGKKVLTSKFPLKSHFDAIRDLKFCFNSNFLVSVSEDCMMKLWDVNKFQSLRPIDDQQIEPVHTFRGHTGPLFSVTSNHSQKPDDNLIYSAGSEGVIRVWRIPDINNYEDKYDKLPKTNGKNYCLGVFSSHKDVVWQLVYHPIDDQLLSVSADGDTYQCKLGSQQSKYASNIIQKPFAWAI